MNDHQKNLLSLFIEAGAYLEGHFLLSSGLHSSHYLQCAKVLCYPDKAELLGQTLARAASPGTWDAVISPALGGIIIGQEVARALAVRHIFTERAAGAMALRRGFEISSGERLLIVEDVLTTGGSTREVLELTRLAGGNPTAAAAIVHRGLGDPGLGVPFTSLMTLNIPAWPPQTCPLCAAGAGPAVKPGSRGAY